MNFTKIFLGIVIFKISAILIVSCKADGYSNVLQLGREPVIEPDYSGVTIPENIAPMNFSIHEEGESFKIRIRNAGGMEIIIRSSDGIVRFTKGAWRKLLRSGSGGKIEIEVSLEDKAGNIKKFDPFFMNVVNESIDPYICYRLLYPGYESWAEMKIVQRSTEDFRESAVFENQLLKDNCVNCHSFKQNNPGKFLLHVRGSMGGTYFVDGEKVTRRVLRTGKRIANAVYPSWHPSGRYIVLSSNRMLQAFHMRPEKNIEVFDLASSLIIYSPEKNEIRACEENDTVQYMETFPCWSPDGNHLYYCRTKQVKGYFNF